MPQWSPSADGVIALCAPTPSGPATSHADQDASLMATLTRLGREPAATADLVDTWSRDMTTACAGNLGNRRIPPSTNYQLSASPVWADLTRLIEQLHAETRVIGRLLRQKKGVGPGLRQG